MLNPRPPNIVLGRRPRLSEKRSAGIVTLKITIADTPEARKDAFEDARPACVNRRGAYLDRSARLQRNFKDRWLCGVEGESVSTYIEDAVDPTELLHSEQENSHTSL